MNFLTHINTIFAPLANKKPTYIANVNALNLHMRRKYYLLIKLAVLLLFSASSSVFAQCTANQVSVQILGSGGPELTDQRASSSYLIRINNKAAILVDTGPGSSLNFERSGAQFANIKAILYSHYHVDHSADLPMYIKASYFTERSKPLIIYGPQGNQLMPSAVEFVTGLFGTQGVYRYLNDYLDPLKNSAYKIIANNIEFKQNKVLHFKLDKNIQLAVVAVHHGPIPALAWRINSAGCSITISGDMNNSSHKLATLAKNSDVLIAHNAIPEYAKGIARNLHMPASEIGKIAAQANVSQLVLSHRMQRSLGQENETRQQIRKHYQGTLKFADDMDVIQLN